MIAITVIVLTMTASQSLLRISVRGSTSVGEKTIALNFAEEALSALVNIRDTNYLRFSSDPDNCWNKLNVTDVSECSSGLAEEIQEGVTYTLIRNYNFSPLLAWNLEEVSDTRDGSMDLYEVDLNGDGSATSPLYAESGITTPGFTVLKDDIFTRTLTITYGDLDGDGTDDYYDATVTIAWEEGSLDRSISVTGIIAHVY
ncbi:MAG: hypothetical protein WC924_06090 [Candidatus Gracilibacteria bacterium]